MVHSLHGGEYSRAVYKFHIIGVELVSLGRYVRIGNDYIIFLHLLQPAKKLAVLMHTGVGSRRP